MKLFFFPDRRKVKFAYITKDLKLRENQVHVAEPK